MSDSQTPELNIADKQVIDELVEHDFQLDKLPDEMELRGRQATGLLGLLEHLPTESPGDLLTERTWQRIEEIRQRERFSQQIEQLGRGGSGPGFRWSDLVAAAAMVLISVSLIWPTLTSFRSGARQFACQQNLAAAGLGFSAYAADNRGALPAVKAHTGDQWWHVNQFTQDGAARSNSAHLFVLIRKDYLKPGDLTCPENPVAIDPQETNLRDWPSAAAVSYSYQNQFTPRTLRWDARKTMAVLADKNPLFQPGHYRQDLPPTSLSVNHSGLGGQNVLMTTGQVAWMPKPVLSNGDNIWRIHGQTTYTGREVPQDETDAFLVP